MKERKCVYVGVFFFLCSWILNCVLVVLDLRVWFFFFFLISLSVCDLLVGLVTVIVPGFVACFRHGG